MAHPPARTADVIIVGAGISGLIAARTLLDAGLTPLILEADERVGGRILTEEVLPGLPVELGAQWIGDTHHRMFALAAELGIETYPQYDQGETSYYYSRTCLWLIGVSLCDMGIRQACYLCG